MIMLLHMFTDCCMGRFALEKCEKLKQFLICCCVSLLTNRYSHGHFEIGTRLCCSIAVTLLTFYRPAMPFGNRKKILCLFSSVLSQLKKYHPSGNLKFYNLGILQGLKLRILVKKKSFQFLLS